MYLRKVMEQEVKINKLWFADNKIFIETDTGEQRWQSLQWYPRLERATAEQRAAYRMSYSGIHWDALDENVSYSSFFNDSTMPNKVFMLFRKHTELNVSAVARRMGWRPSMLGSYICGAKQPSPERIQKIVSTLRDIGSELCSIQHEELQ